MFSRSPRVLHVFSSTNFSVQLSLDSSPVFHVLYVLHCNKAIILFSMRFCVMLSMHVFPLFTAAFTTPNAGFHVLYNYALDARDELQIIL